MSTRARTRGGAGLGETEQKLLDTGEGRRGVVGGEADLTYQMSRALSTVFQPRSDVTLQCPDRQQASQPTDRAVLNYPLLSSPWDGR